VNLVYCGSGVMDTEKKTRKGQEGLILSNKMAKTVVIGVTQRVEHPLYKKYVRRTKKFLAHNDFADCQVGDLVRIEETRPLSRRKRWIVKEVIRRSN
jgi:small subunit ribosomal protein S17